MTEVSALYFFPRQRTRTTWIAGTVSILSTAHYVKKKLLGIYIHIIYRLYCNVVFARFYIIVYSPQHAGATTVNTVIITSVRTLHSVCITRRRFTFHCNIFSSCVFYICIHIYLLYYITFDFYLRGRKNKIDYYWLLRGPVG